MPACFTAMPSLSYLTYSPDRTPECPLPAQTPHLLSPACLPANLWKHPTLRIYKVKLWRITRCQKLCLFVFIRTKFNTTFRIKVWLLCHLGFQIKLNPWSIYLVLATRCLFVSKKWQSRSRQEITKSTTQPIKISPKAFWACKIH